MKKLKASWHIDPNQDLRSAINAVDFGEIHLCYFCEEYYQTPPTKCRCGRTWCCLEHAKEDGYWFYGDRYNQDLVQCNCCKI